MDPASEDERGVDRLRVLAERVVLRVGGLPAVRTLVAVLEAYDGAGGGLMAGGLAYAALIALLPGLLLMLSVFGLLIDDQATREQIVGAIAKAVPPLEEIARTAFEQVSKGAVPTGVIAFVGLLWGASRFYAALDYAFARIFHGARRRNEIERTLRGAFWSPGWSSRSRWRRCSRGHWQAGCWTWPPTSRSRPSRAPCSSWRRRSARSCCS